ncbi:FG-GAP-like repeat-containing protein [Vibrio maritimus]|uniref:FG-GAP-like repeat-containing protein n=1 Tax=Vibrio maritimus TaxID=990268 RepID=UPI003735DCDB
MINNPICKVAVSIALAGFLSACQNETIVEVPVDPLEQPIDLVITLGLQVNYQSCTPRELMEYRVDRAYEIASTLENPIYLAAGKGNGTSVGTCVDKGELTEAAAIKQILIEKYNVAPNRIILEEYSTHTGANATEAKRITDALESVGAEFRTMHLVSSHYHIYRGNISGGDNSAIKSFNDVYGDGTFDSSNSYTSSEFGADEIWGTEFNAAEWNPSNSQVYLGDVNGNGIEDLIAFKDSEVYVSLSDKTAFKTKSIWASNYVPQKSGEWSEQMTRMIGDVNGNGKTDLIAVTDDGVYVSLSTGSAFGEMEKWSDDFNIGVNWDATKHIFSVIDVNNNGLSDLVVFGDDGTYVAFSNGVSFEPKVKVSEHFGLDSLVEESNDSSLTFRDDLNGANVTNRILADVNGDGLVDVVVFGTKGIYAALQDENGSFTEQVSWLDNKHGEGDTLDFLNWSNETHLKTAIDMTGNGRADLATIGNRDLFVPHSNGERFEFLGGVTHYTIRDRVPEVAENWNNFVRDAGWETTTHFRLFGDVTGNGLNDLVGFNDEGVVVSPNVNP